MKVPGKHNPKKQYKNELHIIAQNININKANRNFSSIMKLILKSSVIITTKTDIIINE